MQPDYIFCFIEPEGLEIAMFESLGMRVTYRRVHQGQGTENACFVFENAFIELLWITSEAEARSPAIARTRLWERSLWRTQATCPIGIAWRGSDAAIDTWPFMPPYLSPGVSIPVAIESNDPGLPMLFQSPGHCAPVEWAPERHGGFQHAGGWTRIAGLELSLPPRGRQSPALASLAERLESRMSVRTSERHGLRILLERSEGSGFWLQLPSEKHG